MHFKFSTNKYGWMNWIFDQIEIGKNARVLELGCGNGGLWLNNPARIDDSWDVTLSDISQGMLEAVKSKIHNRFRFIQIDAECIPFENNTFDVVIANHMLYHLPHRDKALSEIKRVMKDGGRFYSSTLGLGNMFELEELVNGFDASFQYPKTADVIRFNLENGGEELLKYFEHVDLKRYEDSLIVTETKPLVDYVLTICTNIDTAKVQSLLEYIDSIIREKTSIKITKDSGIFISL